MRPVAQPSPADGFVRGRGASWRRTSIISQLALLMFAVGLPLVGILAWSLLAQFELDRRQAEQHAVSHAIAAAARIEAVVAQTRAMLQAVAQRPAVRALDPAGCDPFLDELRASLPHYANINTFNLRWEFVCSASLVRGRVLPSAVPELYERMRARDGLVLSAPLRGQLTGRLVVIAAYPIRGDEGQLLGAVTAPIQLAGLAESLRSGERHDIATQLADAAGGMIVRHSDDELGELVLAAWDGGDRKVSTAVDRDGIERLHARAPVGGTDWNVTAALPTAAELLDSGRRRAQVMAAALLVFALSAWIALVLSRRITRPLRELERDARILAGGAFGHRSSVQGPDEVGQLAAAFNDMGRAVQEHEAVRRRADLEVAERQQRLDGVVNAAMDAIVTVDADGLVVRSNPAAHRMFGRSADELFRQPVERILVERLDAAQYRPVAADGIGGRRPHLLRGRRQDGAQFPIEASITHVEAGGRHYATAILRDITERTRSDLQIRRLNRVHAVLTGISSLIVRVRDRDELFREACRVAVQAGAFQMAWIATVDPGAAEARVVALHGGEDGYGDHIRLTTRAGLPESGWPACRVLREGIAVVCNDIATDPALADLREELLGRGHRSLGCFPLRVAGKVEGVMALFAREAGAFDAEETRLLTDLSADLSFALEHLEKQARLDYLAYYDVLTGLANRTLFLERVGQALGGAASGGHSLALFVVDLERFKNFNDTLGRAAGDALLRRVAEWLAASAGAANRVARVGADQFAVMLPQVRAGGSVARFVEKRCQEFMEHAFGTEEAVLRLAIKVGVAVYPDDGADAETLFRNAEAALKKAKATGERFLLHAPQMTAAVAGQVTLENQLRQALGRGEFALHYQPQVCLATSRLAGAEALVRWNDARGPVAPEVFMPVLEETGLVVEVGRWALRQALADYRRWKGQGLAAVRVGVNVAPRQLRHRGFLAEIEAMLGVEADAAAGLALEIPGGLVMEDPQHLMATLEGLRALGVQVAIDDFGSGSSSLSHLARLPADTLKIDRSFVAEMTTGPKGLALVSTIIGLGHSLKLQVVAQGVETEEQSRLLGLLGCDATQGEGFCAPLPADAFEARFLRAPGP